jgi:uncharacterized protein YjbJ (UPF0337 family)
LQSNLSIELETAMSLDQIEGVTRQGIGQVKESLGGAIGNTGLQAKGVLDEALGTVQETYGRVSEGARGALDQATSRARAARGDLEDLIDQQPVLVAAIAIGLGLALGLLLLGGSRVARRR